jgi:hypothetical protein
MQAQVTSNAVLSYNNSCGHPTTETKERAVIHQKRGTRFLLGFNLNFYTSSLQRYFQNFTCTALYGCKTFSLALFRCCRVTSCGITQAHSAYVPDSFGNIPIISDCRATFAVLTWKDSKRSSGVCSREGRDYLLTCVPETDTTKGCILACPSSLF